jgi:hypothetical protein
LDVNGFEDTSKPFVRQLALAPFVDSAGTWNEPRPMKLSNSSLKAGMDIQVGVSTTNDLIKDHYFYISPYYQTDYQQKARIDGAILAWQPVAQDLSLGYAHPNPYYSFFWQLNAEVDFANVSDPGLTNLSRGSHTWIGATTRANLALFPLLPGQIIWPDWIAGRLAFIATAQNYQDTNTRAKANYYSVVLQYKLGPCVKGADPSLPCSVQGSSSISVEYDYGTRRDTSVMVNQFFIKLGYAY